MRRSGQDLAKLASEKQDAKEARKGLPERASSSLTICEPFTMPDGNEGLIHPASLEDEIWINGEASAEVEALKIPQTDPRWEPMQRGRAMVYQTIACFRKSEDVSSDWVYGQKDAERFRIDPAYRVAIRQVCSISDRLAGSGFAKAGYDLFFDSILGRLEGLYSQLNSDSPCLDSCRKTVTDLTDFLTLTKQRKSLSGMDEPGEEEES